MRTIEQLERDLQGSGRAPSLEAERLTAIRRRGRGRRLGRRTAAGAGLLAGAVALAGLVVGGTDEVLREQPPVTSERESPRQMSELAERALAEIPGAEKVSRWQVVIPGPDRPARMDEWVSPDRIVGPLVDTGTRHYLGPTIFDPSAFPRWLYDGVAHVEQSELGSEEGGYPVGSTEPGILVDYGSAQLACVLPQPGNWEFDEGVCRPTMLSVLGDDAYLRWGLGTDRFLQTDAPMEVFLSPDYSTGRETHLAVAGLDGTDVARADFVSADGTVIEGTVLSGNVMVGDTLMFANVPGKLASVIAYDAQGGVVENHPLRECDGPADCEVR